MTLWETINQELKKAMKARRQPTVDALRLLVAGLTNRKIAAGRELNDADVVGVLQGEAKKRREAGAVYRQAKRDDLAAKEEFELQTIERFLPKQLSEADLKKIVADIKTAGKLGPDFGSAMKRVMAQVAGRADGKQVSQAVKEQL